MRASQERSRVRLLPTKGFSSASSLQYVARGDTAPKANKCCHGSRDHTEGVLASPSGIARVKAASSTGSGSGSKALLTGSELAVARKAPAAALQTVTIHRRGLGMSRKYQDYYV